MKRRFAAWLVYVYFRTRVWMPSRLVVWARSAGGRRSSAAFRLALANWRRRRGIGDPFHPRGVPRAGRTAMMREMILRDPRFVPGQKAIVHTPTGSKRVDPRSL